MSEVYEVENTRLGSRYALKLFACEKDDPEVRERFLAEGRLLARLHHPRIVKVVDLGTDDASGQPYFVMDLVLNERGEMQALSDVEPGTVDEETVGKWYDDLREGLAYIHANGVVHRDLKLQNVLIGPDGHVVLADFGISKIGSNERCEKPIVDTVKTLVKMREGRSLVMGSIGYMAPELEMGVAASPQSDYYALGVIVYRLLTGIWCDARTDVVAALETYDPVWKQILPKLLHSNPNGRECLSYEEQRRIALERSELAWEERWLAAKSRGHNVRHVAWYLSGLVAVLGLVFSLVLFHVFGQLDATRRELAIADARLSLPGFLDVCKQAETPSGDVAKGIHAAHSRATLVDAWVVTHGVFEDLKQGRITYEKAVDELERITNKARTNYLDLFGIGNGYMPIGNPQQLVEILENAVRRMKEMTR